MEALHLPAVPAGTQPPFSFPDHPPSPSDLQYTPSTYPEPSFSSLANIPQHIYLIRVLTTALTRGELSWQEILDPSRFHPYGSAIPGHDIVGIVDKIYPVSPPVSSSSPSSSTAPTAPKFSLGDRVWGLLDFDRDGAASSFTIAYESELSLAPHPPPGVPLSRDKWDEELATLPLSGLTAYQALFTHGNLPTTTLLSKPSSSPPSPSPPVTPQTKRVLITGASGSVGIPTIQLAKAAGFHTIAVCSASSRPFVQGILSSPSASSCDHTIIDYRSSEYTSTPSTFQTQGLEPVDLVVDCVGGTTLQAILLRPSSVVKPHGRIVTIVAPIHTFGPVLSAQIQQACAAAEIDAVDFFIVKPSAQDLAVLGGLVEQGRLRGQVDAVFDLEHGREAMQLVESRGRRGVGKVVLRVADA